MQELYNKTIDLRAACQKEFMQREEVKQSDSYKVFDRIIEQHSRVIEAMRAQQEGMLEEIPDSKGALAEAERELFEVMKASGKETFGDAKLKFSKSRTVDKERLLHILDGDLSRFYRFANVTLKSVEQAAKEDGDKRLLGCIETVATPVGVEFLS